MYKVWILNKTRLVLLCIALLFATIGLGIQVVHAAAGLTVTTQPSATSNFDLLDYRVKQLEGYDISQRLTRLEDMAHSNNELLVLSLGGIAAMVLESGYRILSNVKKRT